jgi:hypothetical protein
MKRLDAAWVLGLLADIADEILDERTKIQFISTEQRASIARLVLARVRDVQQLDPDALPDCRQCGNSGAVDKVVTGAGGGLSRVTVQCDCGHALVQPAGGDRR